MIKIFSFSLLFAVSLLCTAQTFGQVRCGADEARGRLIAKDPSYKRALQEMDDGIINYIKTHKPDVTTLYNKVATTLYYIPVVVHCIYDGPANAAVPNASQITDAINYINQVYDGTWTGTGGAILGAGNLQIKFVLATKDPSNNITTGIDRVDGSGLAGYSANGANANGNTGASEASVKNLTRWDSQKYYNIWLVHKIDGCTGVYCGCSCDAGYIAGYAYFPMPPNTTAANQNLDGTILLNSAMVSGNKGLPHELGHALNLYHPFQGNDPSNTGANTCPSNATPATDGDKCTDTQPVTNPQFATVPFSAFQCRTGNNPCVGANYNDNTEKNYMNYTNCYQLFTSDQKARMQAAFAITQRSSLGSSWATGQGSYPAPFVAPIAATSTPVSTLTNPNIAGILNISLAGKVVNSLNATQDGGYLNNSNKWYDVFQLNASTSYTLDVVVFNNTNNSQLGVWIDYDNDGSFNNTNEQVFLNTDIIGTTTSLSIPITTAGTFVGANNFVRMRISQDLSTVYGVPPVSNNSTALTYGQAEDYPVYLSGSVLPVSLISFTGSNETDAINLNWNTSQEINLQSFEVERSLNTKPFATIGTVLAKGLQSESVYNFKDNDISTSGSYLYRLKMTDLNGAFKYSKIINFKIYDVKKLLIAGNPIKNNLNLILPYSNGNSIIRLTDATGRIVYNKNITLNNNAAFNLPLQNYISNGLYVLEVIINGEKFTQKIIKN